MTGSLFVAALGLCLGTALAALVTPARARPLVAGLGTACAGAAGVASGGAALLAGMGVAAACCVLLALAPALVLPALTASVATVLPGVRPVSGLVTLRLTGVLGAISPLLIAVALLAVAASFFLA